MKQQNLQMAFKNFSKISCFFTCSCAAVPQGCCWVRVTKKGRFLCEMATAQISRNRLKAQLKLGTLTVCFRVQKYKCGCLKVQGCLCQDAAAGPRDQPESQAVSCWSSTAKDTVEVPAATCTSLLPVWHHAPGSCQGSCLITAAAAAAAASRLARSKLVLASLLLAMLLPPGAG